MLAVTDNAVEQGFSHIETLASLHIGKAPAEQLEAMFIVMESFGMEDSTINSLIKRLAEFVPEDEWLARGWVLIGFLVGLSTAQNAQEQ